LGERQFIGRIVVTIGIWRCRGLLRRGLSRDGLRSGWWRFILSGIGWHIYDGVPIRLGEQAARPWHLNHTHNRLPNFTQLTDLGRQTQRTFKIKEILYPCHDALGIDQQKVIAIPLYHCTLFFKRLKLVLPRRQGTRCWHSQVYKGMGVLGFVLFHFQFAQSYFSVVK
jgi:hypothetical protein